MRLINKYQANDGSEWPTEELALKRDQLHAAVATAMAPLGDTPQAVEYGKGWLQHDPETVAQAKDDILTLCRAHLNLAAQYPAFKAQGRDCHPLSIVGRVLDDVGGPLGKAWSRFCRIDPEGREHQQCYYAYTAGPDCDHYCVEDRRTTK